MPRSLTAEQRAALDLVAAAHRTKTHARHEVEQEARKLIAERMDAAEMAESRAVREALRLGVPRSRIGREGLTTSDFATVGRVLALSDAEALVEGEVLAARAAPRARLANPAEATAFREYLLDRDDAIVRVDWRGFMVTDDSIHRVFGARVDLHGFVHKAPRPRDRFESIEDDEAPTWMAVAGGGPLGDCARLEPAVQDVIERAMAAAG